MGRKLDRQHSGTAPKLALRKDRLDYFSKTVDVTFSALSTFAGDDLWSNVWKFLHLLFLFHLGHDLWSFCTAHWKTLAKGDNHWIEGSIGDIQKDVVRPNVIV